MEDTISREVVLNKIDKKIADVPHSETGLYKTTDGAFVSGLVRAKELIIHTNPVIPTVEELSISDLEEMKEPMYDSSGNMIGYGVLMEEIRARKMTNKEKAQKAIKLIQKANIYLKDEIVSYEDVRNYMMNYSFNGMANMIKDFNNLIYDLRDVLEDEE